MQVVIVVPEFSARVNPQFATELLMRPVCGVPLLVRTLATAERAGASEILFVWPEGAPEGIRKSCLGSSLLKKKANLKLVRVKSFNPRSSSSWANIGSHLESSFTWLPYNWVMQKQSLGSLSAESMHSVNWNKAAYIAAEDFVRAEAETGHSTRNAEGICVVSPESAAEAERFLIARSGKVLDGIHTSFNRRLCRPVVRLISHTRITPNLVSFGGVLVAAAAAIAFAHAAYWSDVVGAVLFFIAGLFDEIDGMIARIKFAESPFGTWLEGFADGLSYLLLFGGITIGLYHRHGCVALATGGALLAGTLLSLIVTSLGRKRATAPDRPNEYLGRFYTLLEKDSSNWISRGVRQVQAFQKRGVMIHYVLIFTVIGALPLLFVLATIGAHLTWILSLYFNRRFFAVKANVNTVTEAL